MYFEVFLSPYIDSISRQFFCVFLSFVLESQFKFLGLFLAFCSYLRVSL